jgi:hypothetical protein
MVRVTFETRAARVWQSGSFDMGRMSVAAAKISDDLRRTASQGISVATVRT